MNWKIFGRRQPSLLDGSAQGPSNILSG